MKSAARPFLTSTLMAAFVAPIIYQLIDIPLQTVVAYVLGSVTTTASVALGAIAADLRTPATKVRQHRLTRKLPRRTKLVDVTYSATPHP